MVYRSRFKVNFEIEEFVENLIPKIERLSGEDALEMHRTFRHIPQIDANEQTRRKAFILNARYELAKKGQVEATCEKLLDFLDAQPFICWNSVVKALWVQAQQE